MSFSKRLEDFVTCPLCLEIFTQPDRLPCQHTFCRACIRDVVQRLWQAAWIECPVCRKGCSINHIKEDPRALSLVDIYKESQLEEQAESHTQTGASKAATLAYTPQCETCPVDSDVDSTMYCDKCMYENDDCHCTYKQEEEVEGRQEVREKQKEEVEGQQEVREKQEVSSSVVSKQEQEVRSPLEEKLEVMSLIDDKQEINSQEVEKQDKETSREVKPSDADKEEEAKAQLKELLEQVKELRDETEKREQLGRDMIAQIKEQEKEQIAQVRRLQQEELEKVDRHHNERLEDISNRSRGLQKHLETGSKIYIQGGQMLQEKIAMATAASESYNIRQLNACCEELSPAGMADINEIRAEMARFNDEIHPREVIIESPDWNPSTSTRLEVAQSSLGGRSFRTMVGASYVATKCVDLSWSCYSEKISLIGNELWCAAYNDGIYVYSKDCVKLRVIKVSQIEKVRSVAKTDAGDIIVACDDSIGLVRLNPEETYRCTITLGNFSDITFVKDTIYALEYEECKVIAYTLEEKTNQWVASRTYALGFVCDSWDKLAVSGDHLYVSSVTRNAVFVYSSDGDLVEEHVNTRPNTTQDDGRFPLLCDVDSQGCPFICDYKMKELRVYLGEGQGWEPVRVDKDVQRLIGAAIDEDVNTLWVITRNKQMMKFCRK